jgi:hypothetical protein
MIRVLSAALVAAMVTGAAAAPKAVTVDAPTERIARTVPSGSESRIGVYYNVQSDCTSGQIPIARVIKAPTQGKLRFNSTNFPIKRAEGDARAHCNGMQVEALAVYYDVPEGLTGVQTITIDSDTRTGSVRRFFYTVTVQ